MVYDLNFAELKESRMNNWVHYKKILHWKEKEKEKKMGAGENLIKAHDLKENSDQVMKENSRLNLWVSLKNKERQGNIANGSLTLEIPVYKPVSKVCHVFRWKFIFRLAYAQKWLKKGEIYPGNLEAEVGVSSEIFQGLT